MDEIKIIWSDFSLDQIELIAQEIQKDSLLAARKMVIAILDLPEQLKKHPNSGTIEPNLKSLKLDHRFLVLYNYKIIYRLIDSKTIYITDVFSTYQNPNKILKRAAKIKNI